MAKNPVTSKVLPDDLPWQHFMDWGWQIAAMNPDVSDAEKTDETACQAMVVGRAVPATNLREGMEYIIAHADECWDTVAWIVLHALDFLPADLRVGFIDCAPLKKPAEAARVYRFGWGLTETERQTLYGRFATVMPFIKLAADQGTLDLTRNKADWRG